MFVDFDVTASREPPFGVTVVDQEDPFGFAIDEHAVGDKVLRRCCGLRHPEDVFTARKPGERVEPVIGFQTVVWLDLFDQPVHDIPHDRQHATRLICNDLPRTYR